MVGRDRVARSLEEHGVLARDVVVVHEHPVGVRGLDEAAEEGRESPEAVVEPPVVVLPPVRGAVGSRGPPRGQRLDEFTGRAVLTEADVGLLGGLVVALLLVKLPGGSQGRVVGVRLLPLDGAVEVARG